MANAPSQAADSSAVADIVPLRDSFLRHLHAERTARWTRITCATAIDSSRLTRPRKARQRRRADPGIGRHQACCRSEVRATLYRQSSEADSADPANGGSGARRLSGGVASATRHRPAGATPVSALRSERH